MVASILVVVVAHQLTIRGKFSKVAKEEKVALGINLYINSYLLRVHINLYLHSNKRFN
uniref:Uncharacterized protein n=1 Tax=Picea glauca TaxID=3330 RepID=A0A101M1J3_PICGL|nr:hypothetical protein ABT39_MTgene3808 [Picea glauca]